MPRYACPDCDGVQMKFLKVSSEGIYFFCYYCNREVMVMDAKPEYLPNRVVILRKKFPGI